MNKSRTRVFLGLFGLFLVPALSLVALFLTANDSPNIIERVDAQAADKRRFRFLFGKFMGEHASYTFQTPPEEKNYADDCIGCEQEVGNAVIWAEFGCPETSKYLFESNSKNDVVERTSIFDSNGKPAGEQRIWASKDKSGKIVSARVFWIEGNDFWAVQAPSVVLAKALREGDEYKFVREKLAGEIKTYVPIRNANTIGKDRCKDGVTQRRIQH